MAWHSNIDKIFIINLPENESRLEATERELKVCGVQKWSVANAEKHEVGEKGLCHTMVGLLDFCIRQQYKTVLILEDDCQFDMNETIVNAVFNSIPKDFDLLYMGCTLMNRPERVNQHILKVAGAYSSHAILYSASGLQIAYNALVSDHVGHAYDVLLQQQHHAKRYCAYPMLCVQRPGISDIYKHDVNNKILEPYYNRITKVVDWGAFMQRQFLIHTKNL